MYIHNIYKHIYIYIYIYIHIHTYTNESKDDNINDLLHNDM